MNRRDLLPLLAASTALPGFTHASLAEATVTAGAVVPEEQRQERFHAAMHRRAGDVIYKHWLQTLELADIDGDTAHVTEPTRLLARWVDHHYSDLIVASLGECFPAVTRYSLWVRTASDSNAPAGPPGTSFHPVEPNRIADHGYEQLIRDATAFLVSQGFDVRKAPGLNTII